MCFSAEASFGLAGLLLPAGCYCVQSAIRKNRSLLLLSVTPIIFGIQQVCEGFVWRGFAHDDARMIRVSALAFLFFALSFWPFWIPFLALIGEPSKKRRLFFGTICFIGLIGGLGAYFPLVLNTNILSVDFSQHSVHYNISESPAFHVFPMVLWQSCYIAIVSAPLFASNSRNLVYLGSALVLSALVTHIVFWYTFASVWCFFAAALSLYLCWFFRNVTAPLNVMSLIAPVPR